METIHTPSQGRILLIEDDPAQRLVYADRLAAAHYEVLCAEGGEAGLRLARAQRPDLIISDLMMPGWDGYRVLAEVRADPLLSQVRLLFLTALGDTGHIRRGMNLGVDDYLAKPVTGEDLLDAVRIQIEKGRQARAAVERGIAESLGGLESVLKGLRHPVTALLTGDSPTGVGRGVVPGEQWEEVQQALHRVHFLVDRALEWVRAGGCTRIPRPVEVPVAAAVKAVLGTLPEVARICMETSDEQLKFVADPVDFAELVFCLVDNALRFSPSKSPVWLRWSGDGEHGWLEVEDLGPGVHPSERACIFLPFQRGAAAQRVPGNGLGLSIARQCAERNGGAIEVNVGRRGGACFRIRLPLASGVPTCGDSPRCIIADTCDPAESRPACVGEPSSAAAGIHVLIVDPEPLVQRFLRNHLSRYSCFHVDGYANSIVEAKSLLKAQRFDLVFLEAQLADGKAFDLLPHLTADTSRVLMSAHDGLLVEGLIHPWFACIPKPLTPKRTTEVLLRFIASRPASATDSSVRSQGFGRRVFLPDASGRSSNAVDVASIRMILAEREYSRVVMCEGGTAHLRKSLADWENELPFPDFVRVRRGTIINAAEISRIQRQGRKVTLHLTGGGPPVEVSYRFAPALNRALRQTARSELR